MKTENKRIAKIAGVSLAVGFLLGVYVAHPSPKRTAVDRVRDANARTDAWLASLESELGD